MNYKKLLSLLILVCCIFYTTPVFAAYSYNPTGSISLSKSFSPRITFSSGDTKVVYSYEITPPNSQPVMRLTGTLSCSTVNGWSSGVGSHSGYTLYVRIYGKRANGSLGEYNQVGFTNSDGATEKSFDFIYNENYSVIHVDIVVTYWAEWGTNTLNYGSVTGTAQCYKGIYNMDESDIATILSNTQSAKNAANAAQALADSANANAINANANATNAYNAVSNSNGNTITAVRDAGGTVLSEARQAKTNSLNAYNTAQTVNNKIDTLSTAVTNIQNSLGADTAPPEVKIRTASGALATSGNSIRVVVDASDNISTTFSYSLDGTFFQPLPADGVINLPLHTSGSNLITVWVKDEAGNTGRGSITIRKLA